MFNFSELSQINPTFLAFLAGLFTWSVTALGAALIFIFKNMSRKVLNMMMGFAGGVMIAASFFSLIIPALEYASVYNPNANEVVVVVTGFILGALFVHFINKVIPHTHYFQDEKYENGKMEYTRAKKIAIAMMIHNIPEGLAIGVGFGAYAISKDPVMLAGSIALAIGIGLQNFPEGTAVSFPLYREGMSKKKAWLFAQSTAIVEPIAAVLGAALVVVIAPILPISLAFAAGAMIYVVAEDLIPEAHSSGKDVDLISLSLIVGLAVMMTLDIILG